MLTCPHDRPSWQLHCRLWLPLRTAVGDSARPGWGERINLCTSAAAFLRLLPCDHRIPPRADALQALIVAIQHLQRCAHLLLLCATPQIDGRRLFTAGGAEQSVMPPETGKARQFLGLPSRIIDVAAAPPILDEKIRGRAHVERRHEIIVMPAERRDNLLAVDQRQIIALSDIV